MDKVMKKNDKWFPIITRRGAVLLGWLESAGFGEKLLEFTNLDLTEYKEIRLVKDKEYTIFLEGDTWSKTEDKFRKRLRADETYLNRIFKKFYPRLSKLERFSRPRSLTRISNSQLADWILVYADLYTDIAPFYIVYNEVRPILIRGTENWLKKRVLKSKLQEYHITLTTPLKPLYAVEEDRAVGRILAEIKLNKKTRKLFRKDIGEIIERLPKVSPSIFKKIKKHLKIYYWVPVERDNPRWEIEDVVSRIQYKLRRRRRAVKKREGLEGKQRRYEGQLKIPPKVMRIFKELRELMTAVDAMKKAYAVSHCFLSDLLEEIAGRLEVEKETLYFFTPDEIAKSLRKRGRMSETKIKSRNSCIVAGYREKGKWQVKIIKGREAATIIQKLVKPREIKKEEIIEGTPASPGKVVGVVKVLKNASEVDKLSQDDILVTPMTTPDYIIAIHKAVAVVTDEGGVLCHAAIVSREFGIPCIIGTKVATMVLKDGDFVEVDATRGIIRKIKK